MVAPCAPGVFVAARLECFPALLCVLMFHQVLLNTEEGSRPPTSQINCLIDCRGGSEADGWPYKALMRPYLQTFTPYFHKLERRLGRRPPEPAWFCRAPSDAPPPSVSVVPGRLVFPVAAYHPSSGLPLPLVPSCRTPSPVSPLQAVIKAAVLLRSDRLTSAFTPTSIYQSPLLRALHPRCGLALCCSD